MRANLIEPRTMILARRRGLTVRLALDDDDVQAAQRLRYRIFYEEMGASADDRTRMTQLDSDRFDIFCDHLLVVEDQAYTDDGTHVRDGRLVGTYRLLRQDVAERHGGFYSQGEFDVASLVMRHPQLRFLEVGRSCVAQGFRDKPAAELLWQGIWNYVRHHKLDVMLGCASLAGTNPVALSDELTFLAQATAPPEEWSVQALPSRKVEMKRKPVADIDQRRVLKSLPTLVKAYMRLGCYFGDGAVIDQQFNTTDVLIVLPVSAINKRYFAHYGEPAPEHHLPTS
jgi:L-ornithine Nalpha-acyltransferase